MNFISIISINRNNKIGLQRTIDSVICQSKSDYELIIIDGGSKDGSLELIHQYSKNFTYWNSEPDNGIYHAMNKGILKATGEYLLFLNSGDWFVDEHVLENVFHDKQTADIISGDIYFYDSQKKEIKWRVNSPDKITAKTLFYGNIPHQATFIRRELFNKFGLYNEELKIASDWLFFQAAFIEHGATYHHVPLVVSFFNIDGIICRPETNGLPRKEQMEILKKKYPLFIDDYLQLEKLEKSTQEWFQSKEYQVFICLKKLRIISFCVLIYRILRFAIRKLKK